MKPALNVIWGNRRLRRANASAGAVMLEMLVVGLALALVATGLITVFRTSYTWETVLVQQSGANADARKVLDQFAEHVRGAQKIKVGNNPSTAVTAATSNSITFYSDSNASTAMYWMDSTTSPATLKVTKITAPGPSIPVTIVLATGIQSLALTYYKLPSGHSGPANQWVTTTNPSVPTAAEYPLIGAVSITVTFGSGSTTRTMTSFVRLRNSP